MPRIRIMIIVTYMSSSYVTAFVTNSALLGGKKKIYLL